MLIQGSNIHFHKMRPESTLNEFSETVPVLQLHSLSSCHARHVNTFDIVQVVLDEADRYMVLCSDGIYEFMTNDDIVNLVHAQAEQGALAAQIAQHLVRLVLVS